MCVHHVYSLEDDLVVIGKPDVNMHGYVVDRFMRPVPVGAPGELLLSGPRLALGYANRPDLTSEKFIPNPCLSMFEDLLPSEMVPFYRLAYRTGDLVRWRRNGEIEYLGRIDRQVKVNGVRIELGEVEAVLGAAPDVEASVASAVKDPKGKYRLVGYVTPGSVDVGSVMAHCREQLVASMVPSVVVCLDSFPLLPNGKVDVRSLPVPDWEGEVEEEYVEPATDMERLVSRVWSEVLGREEPLGATSDFFAAGGTSLQVFRVTAALQKELDLDGLRPSVIHTERTVRRVAAALSSLLEKGGEGLLEGAPPLVARRWGDALRPLSSNQEQMWVLAESGNSVAYNMPFVLQLDGVPDVEVLRRALHALACRHEVLRMHYVVVDGVPMGKVPDPSSFVVPCELIAVGSDVEFSSKLSEEVATPFDFSRGPLLRAKLFSVSEGSSVYLVLTLHHAVGDAWSWSILCRDLSMIYNALLADKQADLPELPIQYADYSLWQQSRLAGSESTRAETYWREALSGAPSMLQLPTDHSRPSAPTFEAARHRTSIPSELMAQASRVAHRLGVNTQAVYLAAVQLVLMRYSGQDDLVVGVPTAGRDQPETQGLIGYFINTIPVRAVFEEEDTFSSLVRRASSSVVDGLDNSIVPLERIVSLADVERSPNVNPLFQVLFQYLPSSDVQYEFELGPVGCSFYNSQSGLSKAKVDLMIILHDAGSLAFEYMAELFDSNTISQFGDTLLCALESALSAPETNLGHVEMLSSADTELCREFVTRELRPQYIHYPMIHHAFESVAASHPDRECLEFGGQVMTYGEVNSAANKLAHALMDLGLGLGGVVGIMLERSFNLVVCILAALKTGGEVIGDQFWALAAAYCSVLVVGSFAVLFSCGTLGLWCCVAA